MRSSLPRTSRRLYSRVILGLSLKGRYYFLTLTSSPESPQIEVSWKKLKWYLKYHRPESTYCYCLTNEGHGVIHIVLRLGKHEKRIDVVKLREYWEDIHKANQIKILRVRSESEKQKLSSYISDQRKSKKQSGEMCWQDEMIRWHWVSGWIPKGYGKKNGKYFAQMKNDEKIYRDNVLKNLVRIEARVEAKYQESNEYKFLSKIDKCLKILNKFYLVKG